MLTVHFHLLLSHSLAGELVLLTLVLLLQLRHIALHRGHTAHSLNLLDEQRNGQGTHHQGQEDNAQNPSQTGSRVHAQRGEKSVEQPQDHGDDPFKRPKNQIKNIHAGILLKDSAKSLCGRRRLLRAGVTTGVRGVKMGVVEQNNFRFCSGSESTLPLRDWVDTSGRPGNTPQNTAHRQGKPTHRTVGGQRLQSVG